jgi:hypothetical protein
MKPILLAAVTVGLVTCATDASASDYTAMGVGTNSCGSWTAARRTPTQIPALLDETWVQGFLSGVGSIGISQGFNPLNDTDPDSVWAWIDHYCGAHPLDDIAVAAAAFSIAHPH